MQELAESRRKAAEARKASEEAAARTEQAFCEASPWLNEDRSGNVSCADPGRQAILTWKGDWMLVTPVVLLNSVKRSRQSQGPVVTIIHAMRSEHVTNGEAELSRASTL